MRSHRSSHALSRFVLSLTAVLVALFAMRATVALGDGAKAKLAEGSKAKEAKPVLLPKLADYTKTLANDFASIPQERKDKLDKLALFVRTKRDAGEKAKLIFICTHNSRRSHMSQLWSTVAAFTYGIDNVETFSGGVEATAFNPRAIAALERAGFKIENPGGENPHYRVTYATQRPTVEAFSKKYDDPFNPHEGFAAIMTCSQADKNCPSIQGSSLRVALPFEDPKAADGTSEEAATYDARAKQIATEMFYLFSRVGAKQS